jgi:nucleoside-diphosphate-sugar epimerase
LRTISILGSGWLGLPLARHFTASGYTVKASTRSESRTAEIQAVNAEPFVVDIHASSDISPAFLQADVLIINIPSKNVEAFNRLTESIAGSGIKNILFVSSTGVYDDVDTIVHESDYQHLKTGPLLEIENVFRRLEKVKITIVRFGGLIGYSRHPGRFFRPGAVLNNPDAPVNLIHRDDCIAIISEIVRQGVWGEVFNCCADTHPTKREFYTLAAESIGNAPPELGETTPGTGKTISNDRVKKLLRYEFIHPDLMKLYSDTLG